MAARHARPAPRREGVYYVLGNHDLRVDHRQLVQKLNELGLIHVGGTWREAVVRDTPIVIAGNELPWFGTAPHTAGMPPRDANDLPLRILLAHTPDQFGWARLHDFDLILAGHNHGGQVCLPVIGPILAPSLSGVRYAGGTFRRENTVLHVSRGTGGPDALPLELHAGDCAVWCLVPGNQPSDVSARHLSADSISASGVAEKRFGDRIDAAIAFEVIRLLDVLGRLTLSQRASAGLEVSSS